MILKQTGKLAPADEPYRLLRDMVDDLELQEQCEEVKIYTGVWHEASWRISRCEQCPVGATISRRLGVDTTRTVHPSDFPNEFHRLRALEWFRCGDIAKAFRQLEIEHPKDLLSGYDIPHYHYNPSGFKSALRALADDIERAMNVKRTPWKPKSDGLGCGMYGDYAG
jgi:hypothetical protein